MLKLSVSLGVERFVRVVKDDRVPYCIREARAENCSDDPNRIMRQRLIKLPRFCATDRELLGLHCFPSDQGLNHLPSKLREFHFPKSRVDMIPRRSDIALIGRSGFAWLYCFLEPALHVHLECLVVTCILDSELALRNRQAVVAVGICFLGKELARERSLLVNEPDNPPLF